MQNNYTKRLIEKLREQVKVNGEDSPQAEELERLLNPAGGVSPEDAEGGTEDE